MREALDLPNSNVAIDIPTIEMIHRIEDQQDGFISFCRKVNGDHQDLAGVRVNELRRAMPELLPYLSSDSYFSINSSFRAAYYSNRITGMPSACRKEIYLRYLNACYVDLDFYNAKVPLDPLDWPEAVEIVLRAQEDKIIPLASIIARSGRGMYLLWMLTSGRKGAHQRAFPNEIAQYKEINKALIERVNSYNSRLNADGIFDAARVFRVPGSVNSKSGSTVQFLVEFDDMGRVPVYTLNELGAFLEISPCPFIDLSHGESLFSRPIKNRGSAPNRRNGKIATAEYRLNDLFTLYQYREGFKQGRRRRSITYFCHFAKVAGWTKSDILERSRELADGCVPPYPSDKNDTPLEGIVDGVWNDVTKKFRNDKLAKYFSVSAELAEELNLHSIIPEVLKKKQDLQPSGRERKRVDRRQAIEEILSSTHHKRPSCRAVKNFLQSRGIKASLGIIHRDIQIRESAGPQIFY